MPRLLLDVTTLAHAGGQAVGIVRVLRELALWASKNRDDVVFVMLDLEIDRFRSIARQAVRPVLYGSLKIDPITVYDPQREKRRLRDRVPPRFRELALWVDRPRRQIAYVLEGWRLSASSPASAKRIEKIQNAFLPERLRKDLIDPLGKRRTLVRFDRAVGPVLDLRPDDVFLFAGADWGHLRTPDFVKEKQRLGFKAIVLCYDIIAILYPNYFSAKAARLFRSYFQSMLPLADLILFTASAIQRDAAEFCGRNGLKLGASRVIQLGADRELAANAPAPLPAELEPERYALFVATIEPRKGHGMLFSVWKRLLDAGIPQAQGFKMVFVGRRGWLTDALLAEMAAHPSYGDSLLVYNDVNDHQLAALYRNAAFCLYPSMYEGYGLPVVEGFRYGKAILASTGGALPEVVNGFSPCIDATDEQAWFEALKTWIVDPSQRAPYEKAIRERFRHPTWKEAAEAYFRTVDAFVSGGQDATEDRVSSQPLR